jgi:hypothetical protein
MANMEPWAKNWLMDQRSKGVKCLEIKQHGAQHYVYHSTTHWDKLQNKAIKTSKYIGKLDQVRGLIRSHEDDSQKAMVDRPIKPKSITEYGNALLLHEAMKDIKPLLMEAYPNNWPEIYSISILRVMGNIPLKRAEIAWQKLYNVDSIVPNLKSQYLSRIMQDIGGDREGQRIVFKGLLDQSEQLVYDLSYMFSRSVSIRQAEKGYNKDKIQLPQINIVLLCNAETGLPTMIRSLPGSIKDIATLRKSLSELNIQNKMLILNRGFFSEEVFSDLNKLGISYLIPARRNSHYYDMRIHLNGHFRYHKRLIRCGSRMCGDKHLYLFEDQELLLEERNTIYDKLDRGEIDKNQFDKNLKKAGRILILSNREMSEHEAYEFYKKRDVVEKLFDTYKSTLYADRLYLHSDESVFGHVFIGFLSLYAYCKIESLLRKAKLNKTMTPIDLLFEFSKIYHIDYGKESIILEIPKKVRDLDARLKLNLFPT